MHLIVLNQVDLTKVSELTAPHLFIYSFALLSFYSIHVEGQPSTSYLYPFLNVMIVVIVGLGSVILLFSL